MDRDSPSPLPYPPLREIFPLYNISYCVHNTTVSNHMYTYRCTRYATTPPLYEILTHLLADSIVMRVIVDTHTIVGEFPSYVHCQTNVIVIVISLQTFT